MQFGEFRASKDRIVASIFKLCAVKCTLFQAYRRLPKPLGHLGVLGPDGTIDVNRHWSVLSPYKTEVTPHKQAFAHLAVGTLVNEKQLYDGYFDVKHPKYGTFPAGNSRDCCWQP